MKPRPVRAIPPRPRSSAAGSEGTVWSRKGPRPVTLPRPAVWTRMGRARQRGLPPLRDANHARGDAWSAARWTPTSPCPSAAPTAASSTSPARSPRPAGTSPMTTRNARHPAPPGLALEHVAQEVDRDALAAQPPRAASIWVASPSISQTIQPRCSSTSARLMLGSMSKWRTRVASTARRTSDSGNVSFTLPGPRSRPPPPSRRGCGSDCPERKPSRSSATKVNPAQRTASTTSARRATTSASTSGSNSMRAAWP